MIKNKVIFYTPCQYKLNDRLCLKYYYGEDYKMSLEIMKEAININRFFEQQSAQVIIQTDIIVPDVKPDISKILVIDADDFITSTETYPDRVLVEGSLKFKIIYTSENSDERVKSIDYTYHFTQNVAIQGVRQGMKAKAKCIVEHVAYDIVNERKVNVKAIANMLVKVFEEERQQVAYSIEGSEDVQVLRKTLRADTLVQTFEDKYSVSEDMDIPSGKPSIGEILRTDVAVAQKDVKIDENKILIKADINVKNIYASDDPSRLIQAVEHEVPFTKLIEVEEVSENSKCICDINIADYVIEIAQDNDGESRIISFKADVNVDLQVYETKFFDNIEDAYAPGKKLILNRSQVYIPSQTVYEKAQSLIKESIFVFDDKPGISEVLSVIAKPEVSQINVSDDRIEIEGVVDCKILYASSEEDSPMHCAESQLPFTHVIDAKGIIAEQRCSVDTFLTNLSYSLISGNEIEVRCAVESEIFYISGNEARVINSVEETALDESMRSKKASFILYFAQENDTLWDIAKMYSTTMEKIKKVNGISDDEIIEPGRKILII